MTEVYFRCSNPKEVLVERLEKKKFAGPTRFVLVTFAFGGQRPHVAADHGDASLTENGAPL